MTFFEKIGNNTYSFCRRPILAESAIFSYIHCKDKMQNLKQIFPEKDYRGLSPNFHIHVSVSGLFIPTIGLPFLLEKICGPMPKTIYSILFGPMLGIYKSLTDT